MQILTFLFSMRELRRGITVGEKSQKKSHFDLKRLDFGAKNVKVLF